MVFNDDFDGKATNLNCFYLHINFEQKYLKLAVVCSLRNSEYKQEKLLVVPVDFFMVRIKQIGR